MSLNTYIETEEQLGQALQYWKNFTFNPTYLKLEDAVNSLSTARPVIGAHHQYAPRWVLTKSGTKREAIFHTVALWRWNSHLETGNFVPIGNTAPERLAEDRIQTVPNNLCQLSYALDTEKDKSLWDAQKAFEEFILQQREFNVHKKTRRQWQSGSEGNDSTFILTSQIFCKRTPYTRVREASIPYRLHPWVAQATAKGTEYFANPDRPTIMEPSKGELRDIKDCDPPYLKLGHLVWLSFTVEFFIGVSLWSTNFIPLEFVRVGRVSTDLLAEVRNFELGDEEASPRDRLAVGQKITFTEDFPMFQPTDGPGISNDVEVRENEVRFGPTDADDYRELRRDELERSAAEVDVVDSADAGRSVTPEIEYGEESQAAEDEPRANSLANESTINEGTQAQEDGAREVPSNGGPVDNGSHGDDPLSDWVEVTLPDTGVQSTSSVSPASDAFSIFSATLVEELTPPSDSPPTTPTPAPKKAAHKRLASTERPEHVAEDRGRVLRGRKNVPKSRP